MIYTFFHRQKYFAPQKPQKNIETIRIFATGCNNLEFER
jgi:hypothetical protein